MTDLDQDCQIRDWSGLPGGQLRFSRAPLSRIESMLNSSAPMWDHNQLRAYAAAAVAAEREACAQAAEGFSDPRRDWVTGSLWGNIRACVAAAIRARGAKS